MFRTFPGDLVVGLCASNVQGAQSLIPGHVLNPACLEVWPKKKNNISVCSEFMLLSSEQNSDTSISFPHNICFTNS